MLWQKEVSGGLYVDLLESLDYPINLCQLKRRKNNLDSLRARMDGNQKFKNGDFHGAMNKYNQSICLAENGSECLSLAYGNRSSCFEKLRMYHSCLKDIHLAKDSDYPERLMQKLNDRSNKCMLEVQSEKLISNQPTLSFDADENLYCMANVLRVEVNNTYGRLITATQDIRMGETVLIEEEYIRFVVGENIKCTTCGKENVNFVPCEKCGGAMFCSKSCMNNNFHKFECEMLFDIDFCCAENYFPLFVLRSIIIGLNSFSSITEMEEFVENCRSTDPHEIPFSLASPISKYRTFFKLSSHLADSQLLNMRKMAYFIYHSIKGSSSLPYIFQTKAHQRFLTHLIAHHYCILRTNHFGGFSEVPTTVFGESVDLLDNDSDYEMSLLLVTSYFNHSCCPNISRLAKDNLAICKAILPIRKGDQLFVSYVDDDDENCRTKNERQSYLEKNYGFRCKCRICEKGILQKTYKLQDDSAFVNVIKGVKELENNLDMKIVHKVKENCELFLTKYPHMIPTGESQFISTNFERMLQLELKYHS